MLRIFAKNFARLQQSLGAPDSTYSEVWKFGDWWSEYDKKRNAAHYAPMDFLYDGGGFVWLLMVENNASRDDCGGYDIIDFEGGLYAVHTSIDADNESTGLVLKKIEKWIEGTNFEIRQGCPHMGHMINPTDDIKQGLGYHQFEIFVPIQLRIG